MFSRLAWYWRLIVGLLLVFITYNPHGFVSYVHWAFLSPNTELLALKVFAGITLFSAWFFVLSATWDALGKWGLLLAVGFFISLVWVLVELQILSVDSNMTIQYVILLTISFVISLGVSGSLIKRKLTGQVDVDADAN